MAGMEEGQAGGELGLEIAGIRLGPGLDVRGEVRAGPRPGAMTLVAGRTAAKGPAKRCSSCAKNALSKSSRLVPSTD